MKKIFSIIVTFAGLIMFGASCTKEKTATNFSDSFKNTVWTGEFSRSGSSVQPLSIAFAAGGSVTYNDVLGSSAGVYQLDNDQLTVTISNGCSFKATVNAGNQLSSIVPTSGSNWLVNTLALNNVAEESLDQTVWTAPNLKLTFKANNKVDMELGPTGATKYPDVTYVLQGKTISYVVYNNTYRWFLVKNSARTFAGANTFLGSAPIYPFSAVKN